MSLLAPQPTWWQKSSFTSCPLPVEIFFSRQRITWAQTGASHNKSWRVLHISLCLAKGICHINLLIAVCVTLSEIMSHSLDTRSHHSAVHLPTDSTLAMPHTGGTVHTRVGTMSTTRLYPPSWPGSGWDSTGTKLLSRDVRGGDDHLREAGRRSNRLFRGVEGINGKAAVWRRRPSFLFRD